jgi:hypothetical protein
MADQDIRIAKFFREHLTAEMIMTELDLDLDAEQSINEGIEYLSNARYDVAILRIGDTHKYVELNALRQAAANNDEGGSKPLKSRASEFPSTRIVSSDLPIRSVAEKLSETTSGPSFPLLVAGREGPEFILTKSDFQSPAGVAAALLLTALVDALLDKELQARGEDAVIATLNPATVAGLIEVFERKKRSSEDLNLLSLLNFTSRLQAFNSTHDPVCQPEDIRWLVGSRNHLAHGRFDDVSGPDLLKFVIFMDTIFNRLSGESTSGLPLGP